MDTRNKKISKTKMQEIPVGSIQHGIEILKDLGMRYRPNAKFKEGVRRKKIRYAELRCHCGNTFVAAVREVMSNKIKSCGCYKSKGVNPIRDPKQSRLYRIYHGMKTRCYNLNHHSYPYYGGRGITICTLWLEDFLYFRDWAIGEGYTDNLSIDRIDVDGDYCQDNCRWVTKEVQANNQRLRKDNKVGYKGISKREGLYTVTHRKVYIGVYESLAVAIEVKEALNKYTTKVA